MTFTDNYPTESINQEIRHKEDTNYLLPPAGTDQERLIILSRHHQEVYGGNILSVSREFVSFKEGTMVLDIGYGSGSWLMEMNKEFPDAKYVGVDISGAIPDYRAYNVTYEFGNIVKGLKYPDQSFDFINVRLLIYSLSVDEWHIALKEIRRLLKPEGCVQFMECQNVSTEPKDRSDYENAIFEAATEVGQDPMILHNFEKYAKNCEMRVIQKDQRHIFFGEKHSRMDLFSRMWQLTHEAFLTNVGPRLGISVSEYKSYAERYIKWQTETNAEFIWCGFLVRKK